MRPLRSRTGDASLLAPAALEILSMALRRARDLVLAGAAPAGAGGDAAAAPVGPPPLALLAAGDDASAARYIPQRTRAFE